MTDKELQRDVQNALEWEPVVEPSGIGVTVDQGVVTLRGDVRSFFEKEAAERVALRVYGVKAVANDLDVRLRMTSERTDGDIAHAAVTALTWATGVPEDRITVSVRDEGEGPHLPLSRFRPRRSWPSCRRLRRRSAPDAPSLPGSERAPARSLPAHRS